MASRIMHLTIADEIIKHTDIEDKNRFRTGSLFPDACNRSEHRAITHFQTRLPQTDRITYKISLFREKYAALLSDDFYLGYYIHLVEDLLFRHFVYAVHSWDPFPEGNIARLHNDYRLLNTYLTEKHSLSCDIKLPEDIKKEPVYEIYPFNGDKLITDLKNDFIPYSEGKPFFFTKKMADEYIEFTCTKCIEEIKNLRAGLGGIDETEWAWKR
ncbi:MAG: hypothetical protein IKB08_07655 [Clostridia bacterium]|nr:hypothetical protein [Clostridia bacterium]